MISPLASIHPDARIGDQVEIGPFTTIGADVEVGNGTWIGPNVTIMDGARIGADCQIHYEDMQVNVCCLNSNIVFF